MRILKALAVATVFSFISTTSTIMAINTKATQVIQKKPVIVTIKGDIYTQLAPGTKTNTSWVMFKQDGTNKLFFVTLEGDNYLYDITDKKVKVEITGTTSASKQWPYNCVNVKSVKGDIRKLEELLEGILKKDTDKNGKISYKITKKNTKQVFSLSPKKGVQIDWEKYLDKAVWVFGARASYDSSNPTNGGMFYVSSIQFGQ